MPIAFCNGLNIFIATFDSLGDFIWANQIGKTNSTHSAGIAIDASTAIYITGNFELSCDFNPSNDSLILSSAGNMDIFVAKYYQKGIIGKVFYDNTLNCFQDQNENGFEGATVIIQPGNIVSQTNNQGTWTVDSLPLGNYTITIDTTNGWISSCPITQTFSVVNPNTLTHASQFGYFNPLACGIPDISIYVPYLRRCNADFHPHPITVLACNNNSATVPTANAYVDVVLDTLFSFYDATLPVANIGNNTYRFQIDNINPGECVSFIVYANLSCDGVLGETVCVQAQLYPSDSCVFDTIPSFPPDISPCTLPWDHSNLSVDGYCNNDSVYFAIINNGDFGGGDMVCYQPVRIFVDGVQTQLDSVMLTAGQVQTYSFAATGQTWVMQTEQHPLHPGNSHPNAHVELCGTPDNFTPGIVNNFPQDDADPVVDIFCAEITGSFDPNDKTGFPTGLTEQHFIQPNQQIQYAIRFQNTGNDTAFTVVVRDTLDTDLNIFTVTPGVASHPYTFRMYGPRVLEWTFSNILLPDSNVNEVESHGFLTYHVEQNPNLPDGTQILNEADIYFDFNEPVITNQTLHTINRGSPFTVGITPLANVAHSPLRIFPNPTAAAAVLEFTSPTAQKGTIIVRDVVGRTVFNHNFNASKGINVLPLNVGKSGIFFVSVNVGERKSNGKLIIE